MNATNFKKIKVPMFLLLHRLNYFVQDKKLVWKIVVKVTYMYALMLWAQTKCTPPPQY